MALLRTFNEEGVEKFKEILEEIRSGNISQIPAETINSDVFTQIFTPRIEVSFSVYDSKKDLVIYLNKILNLEQNKNLYFNKGLWTWLSAYFFDIIAPVSDNGNRKLMENACYLLNDPRNYTKYYRHILAYLSRVYSELGESANIFLTGNFQKRGELTEQLSAYQEIALNKGIIDAASLLYWNPDTQTIKRGAAGKGGGSVRRLVRIISQYRMTYDLNSLSGEKIVSILPAEFNKWKN